MLLHTLAIHLKDQSKHFLFNNCFFNAQWGHLVIFGRPLGSFEGCFNIDCLVTLYQAQLFVFYCSCFRLERVVRSRCPDSSLILIVRSSLQRQPKKWTLQQFKSLQCHCRTCSISSVVPKQFTSDLASSFGSSFYCEALCFDGSDTY